MQYVATEPDELSLEESDIVNVLCKETDGMTPLTCKFCPCQYYYLCIIQTFDGRFISPIFLNVCMRAFMYLYAGAFSTCKA